MVYPRLIAHVDMNSYFASVEQQANFGLRGRAVGVSAYLHEYGCVIAASIEAKRMGMKVGMTVEEARRMVPDAVFVQNDPAKYRAVTSRIFSLFHELTDVVEHYSIDEAFLDLTGWYRDAAEAAWALTRVRRRIRDEVGDWLRCSIGLAPTRFLAKTASDFRKPNGLTVITLDNLNSILEELDLEDVCGIGTRTRRRLQKAGIGRLVDIRTYPLENLMRLFGKQGYFMWCKVSGIECEKVVPAQEHLPKSVGHSYCVPWRTTEEGKTLPVLLRLADRAGRRMRTLGLLAQGVQIQVGFRVEGFAKPNGPFWQPLASEGGSLASRFSEPCSDSLTLLEETMKIFQQLWHGESVSFLAVTFFDLTPQRRQGRLDACSWRQYDDRRERLSRAIDHVRDRHGEKTLVFGEMMRLMDEAPDRIGFRKTEGVDIPVLSLG